MNYFRFDINIILFLLILRAYFTYDYRILNIICDSQIRWLCTQWNQITFFMETIFIRIQLNRIFLQWGVTLKMVQLLQLTLCVDTCSFYFNEFTYTSQFIDALPVIALHITFNWNRSFKVLININWKYINVFGWLELIWHSSIIEMWSRNRFEAFCFQSKYFKKFLVFLNVNALYLVWYSHFGSWINDRVV